MKNVFVSLIACALLAGAALAEEASLLKVTPYGHAQYRLRLKMTYRNTGDEVLSTYEYPNQIAYFLGTKALVGDQLVLQFQLGNDWVATEKVDWTANNNFGAKSGVYPYFHLAYAAWNPGPFHLAFGIQPVFNYGPLDLLERSIRFSGTAVVNGDTTTVQGGSYAGAALVTYPVGTNNSFMGLSLGAPILKDEFKLGVDYFMTIIENRPESFLAEPEINPNALLSVINLPMAAGDFTITPQAFVLLFKYYSAETGEGDHEFGGGLAATYKLGDKSSLRASFGVAQNSAEKSELLGERTKRGYIAGLEGKFGAGPGSLIAAVNWSGDETVDQDDSMLHFLYTDLKYGWGVYKGLVLMPRVRTFTTLYPDGMADEYKLEVRPELLFIAAF